MKANILIAAILLMFFMGCSSGKVKDNINKAGDVTGQVVGEFTSGVGTGVKKSFDVKVELPEKLKSKGVSFGKMMVNSDSTGTDNVLQVYLIFSLDYNGILIARAFDKNGLEMGRSSLEVKGKKDEARFIEFHFDKLTKIDFDSKLTIEAK